MRCAVFVGLSLIALGFVQNARAANELCGQTVTTSITVAADQSCTGDGLIVGADGITIDLDGFTLSGDRDTGDVSAGVFLNMDAITTLVVQNTAIGNAAGLEVFPPTTTVTKNTAIANVTTGISAPVGATDGGGNTARDNGTLDCNSAFVCN